MQIVHSTDTAEVIQRVLNDTDHSPKSKGLFDHVPLICESSLASKLVWKDKVIMAVKDETSEFQNEVHITMH